MVSAFDPPETFVRRHHLCLIQINPLDAATEQQDQTSRKGLTVKVISRRRSMFLCVSEQFVSGCFFAAKLKLFAGCVY
jgi:hypothetical protein